MRAPAPMHGKVSRITHNARGVFRGLNGPFQATRYHSLIIERSTAPAELEVSAETDDGLIMAVAHRSRPVYGVQFHPESIASEHGRDILRNFLDLAARVSRARPGALRRPPHGILQAPDRQGRRRRDAEPGGGCGRVRRHPVGRSDALADGRVSDGAARARRNASTRSPARSPRCAPRCCAVNAPADAIDIVGTGGDGSGSYNVSTLASIIVAACGVPVAKHGNRAASSRSGAADTLAALGVKIGLPPEGVERCIREAGIGFMMAPAHHAAMRHVGPTRVELGTRTIFNLLGPLSNPAGVKRQLIGVFSAAWLEPMAEVLRNLGSERVWITHGSDGLDEITTTGPTRVVELKNGAIRALRSDAGRRGRSRAPSPAALKGGDAAHNAAALRSVLDGERGAYRDIALVNAAAALVVAGKARSLAGRRRAWRGGASTRRGAARSRPS